VPLRPAAPPTGAAAGEKYVQPPVLDYAAIWRQSSETTPIVFVLSPGADPAFDVFKLGEEMGFKPGGCRAPACLRLPRRERGGGQAAG
jgi:hypothetical protein